jgi:hypothetical protein
LMAEVPAIASIPKTRAPAPARDKFDIQESSNNGFELCALLEGKGFEACLPKSRVDVNQKVKLPPIDRRGL